MNTLGKILKNADPDPDREAAGRSKEQGHGLLSDHLSSSGHAAAGDLPQRAADVTSDRCELRKGRGYFGDLVRGDPLAGTTDENGNGIGGSPLSSFVNTTAACFPWPDGLSAQQAPYHVPL